MSDLDLLSSYDFHLPQELVAIRPVEPRDSSRLLVVGKDGELQDKRFYDLLSFLQPGDALVLNESKVIPAYLKGQAAGKALSCNLLKIVDATGDANRPEHGRNGSEGRTGAEQESAYSIWQVLIKGGRNLRVGQSIEIYPNSLPSDQLPEHGDGGLGDPMPRPQIGERRNLYAEVVGREEMVWLLRFPHGIGEMMELLEIFGQMPLPPYIKRNPDNRDRQSYQTVFASQPGSVAAPTAGLHLTSELLNRIKEIGVHVCKLTLHVGGGTFLPIRSDRLSHHQMHGERFSIAVETAELLNSVKASGRRIVVVGTTTLRALESAMVVAEDGREGSGSSAGQEQVQGQQGRLIPVNGHETDLFIRPGYKFHICDALVTNFHLPRSTLFVLVCAFGGVENMRRAYDHAIAAEYRFFSYGDASLIIHS